VRRGSKEDSGKERIAEERKWQRVDDEVGLNKRDIMSFFFFLV